MNLFSTITTNNYTGEKLGSDPNNSDGSDSNQNQKPSGNESGSRLFSFIDGIRNMLTNGVELVYNKATKTIEAGSSFLTNPAINMNLKDLVVNKIRELNEIINSPEVREQIKELAGTISKIVAEDGEAIVEAASPAMQRALYKIIETVYRGGTKLGISTINMIVAVGESTPVVGVFIGGVRLLSSICSAILTIMNTNTELFTNGLNSVRETIENVQNILNKHKDNEVYQKYKGYANTAKDQLKTMATDKFNQGYNYVNSDEFKQTANKYKDQMKQNASSFFSNLSKNSSQTNAIPSGSDKQKQAGGSYYRKKRGTKMRGGYTIKKRISKSIMNFHKNSKSKKRKNKTKKRKTKK